MRRLLIIIGTLVLIAGFWLLIFQYASLFRTTEDPATPLPHANIQIQMPDPEPIASSLRILFTGDLMLDRGVRYYVEKIGGGDYTFPFTKIKSYLDSFDVVIPNLEGPVSDKGVKAGSIYSFRMDPKVFETFSYANIHAVNVANNHAWDYGRVAFEDMLRRLKEKNIGYFGGGISEAEAYAPHILEKNGVRVGILGFTEFLEHAQADGDGGGIAFTDMEKIKSAIQNAKTNATDAVIVVYHFGEEYIPEPIARQVDLARFAIDEGADLVVGHHPHVVESSEIYKERQIFYSLGNFIFDQSFSKETMTPGFLEVTVSTLGIESALLRRGSMTQYYEVIPPVE